MQEKICTYWALYDKEGILNYMHKALLSTYKFKQMRRKSSEHLDINLGW